MPFKSTHMMRRAEEHADHGAATTLEAGAADHARRDGVELHERAGRRRGTHRRTPSAGSPRWPRSRRMIANASTTTCPWARRKPARPPRSRRSRRGSVRGGGAGRSRESRTPWRRGRGGAAARRGYWFSTTTRSKSTCADGNQRKKAASESASSLRAWRFLTLLNDASPSRATICGGQHVTEHGREVVRGEDRVEVLLAARHDRDRGVADDEPVHPPDTSKPPSVMMNDGIFS